MADIARLTKEEKSTICYIFEIGYKYKGLDRLKVNGWKNK